MRIACLLVVVVLVGCARRTQETPVAKSEFERLAAQVETSRTEIKHLLSRLDQLDELLHEQAIMSSQLVRGNCVIDDRKLNQEIEQIIAEVKASRWLASYRMPRQL